MAWLGLDLAWLGLTRLGLAWVALMWLDQARPGLTLLGLTYADLVDIHIKMDIYPLPLGGKCNFTRALSCSILFKTFVSPSILIAYPLAFSP